MGPPREGRVMCPCVWPPQIPWPPAGFGLFSVKPPRWPDEDEAAPPVTYHLPSKMERPLPEPLPLKPSVRWPDEDPAT